MKNPQVENRTLFTGDNLEVMRSINSETVDLIYLDPPFNKKFVFPIGKGDSAEFGFKDVWGWDSAPDEGNPYLPYAELYAFDELVAAAADGNPLIEKAVAQKIVRFLETIGEIAGHAEMAYLSFMAARLMEMRRLLKPTGSIYLHCDPTMSHSLKLLMDIVFGDGNFRNEIAWCYSSTSQASRWFPRKHDLIFFYAKTDMYKFNKDAVRIAFKKSLVRHGSTWKSGDPEELEARTKKGKIVEDFWTDIYPVNSMAKERTGYPTQKPLPLLERIIKASSNEGDLILDPFCGCATTCVAAERLNRRWVGIDVAAQAAKLVRARLLAETKQGKLGDKVPEVLHRMFDEDDCPMRTDMGEKRSKNIRQILYGMQGGNCNLCKTHFDNPRHLEDDHIIPCKKGGPDADRNLQLLCGSCNRIKSTRTMEQARRRLRELGYI
ncbi:MAG: DNA methyltransferase [Gammaproteobacteria bacterium]